MPEPDQTWMCGICGFEYCEHDGWPEGDIAPGTAWADVPKSWRCPQCGAVKAKFELEDHD